MFLTAFAGTVGQHHRESVDRSKWSPLSEYGGSASTKAANCLDLDWHCCCVHVPSGAGEGSVAGGKYARAHL
eukprot:1161486-Pelagomonas_calceolata.AAC.2